MSNSTPQKVAFVEDGKVQIGYVVGNRVKMNGDARGSMYLVADRPKPPFAWWAQKTAPDLTEIAQPKGGK